MQRRTLLHAATAALPTVLAGCVTDTDESTPTTNRTETPTETETLTPSTTASSSVVAPIRELWTAYNDENETGVAAAFHPDAPNPPQAGDTVFQGTVTIVDTTVTDQSDDEATVTGEFTLTSDDGSTETQEQTYQLRRHDGEWLIYSIDMETGGGSTGETPQISFAFEYDSTATSTADTGVLTITHQGGDNAAAARLFVRGDGIVLPADADPDVTVSGTDWSQATGTESVAAGDDVTVGVSSDCSIRVVWESADGDVSATLAEYDGPDA